MSAQNVTIAPSQWAVVVNAAKDKINNRNYWMALEQSVAITVEGDVLILGLRGNSFNEAGQLTATDHRNAIEQTILQLTGHKLRIRVIEGDSMEDWEYTRERDARAAAARETTYQKRDHDIKEANSWDALYEYCSRSYSSTANRNLAQGKARYLTDMLYAVSDAMDVLYGDVPDEITERSLSRILERIATNADVPATMVALEVERLRAWSKQQPAE